ncbi:hypothetical protein [Leptolyngbya sp. FACHB-261]|uniref:hypothetical protein n=1 Tax=Leptolyngbya sp. FACHB-261 TaxID=2692806 RepID=UPI001681CB9F|nr:hypothetical protein [Leptolyngbya sp. FACHB-261]MBD2099598.1 hypothetical protein [Leptolyngbya sp. FACHB-261]
MHHFIPVPDLFASVHNRFPSQLLPTPAMTSQLRLRLADHIVRRLQLPALLKLMLLVIANYIEPNGSQSRVTLDLLSRNSNLDPEELKLLLVSLEARDLIRKVTVHPQGGGPTIPLYSLSPNLLRTVQHGD